MRNQHKVMAVLMAIGCFWGLQKLPVVAAASGAPVPVGTESGAQLSRLREYLEKERVARDIAAQREKRRESVENKTPATGKEPVSNIKFKINSFSMEKSKVLKSEELEKITGKTYFWSRNRRC